MYDPERVEKNNFVKGFIHGGFFKIDPAYGMSGLLSKADFKKGKAEYECQQGTASPTR